MALCHQYTEEEWENWYAIQDAENTTEDDNDDAWAAWDAEDDANTGNDQEQDTDPDPDLNQSSSEPDPKRQRQCPTVIRPEHMFQANASVSDDSYNYGYGHELDAHGNKLAPAAVSMIKTLPLIHNIYDSGAMMTMVNIGPHCTDLRDSTIDVGGALLGAGLTSIAIVTRMIQI